MFQYVNPVIFSSQVENKPLDGGTIHAFILEPGVVTKSTYYLVISSASTTSALHISLF